MDKMPDYVGNWLIKEDLEHALIFEHSFGHEHACKYGFGNFRFFIDKEHDLDDNLLYISGRIHDISGAATFEGEIGESHIKFVKKYSEDVVQRRLSLDEIPYEGKGVPNQGFSGTYFMKIGLGNKREWKGQFIMTKCNTFPIEFKKDRIIYARADFVEFSYPTHL